jgi:hypothetical protein
MRRLTRRELKQTSSSSSSASVGALVISADIILPFTSLPLSYFLLMAAELLHGAPFALLAPVPSTYTQLVMRDADEISHMSKLLIVEHDLSHLSPPTA